MSHPNPGVTTKEHVSKPVLTGTQFGVCGFVGVCRRGTTTKYIETTSWNDFVRKCGGYYGDEYLPFAVREFFRENKGAVARIARVLTDDLGTPAAKASATFKGLDVAKDTIQVNAKYYGDAGNDISVDTLKYEVLTTSDLESNNTSLELQSVVNVEAGDLVKISDGTTTVIRYVQDIDVSNKLIKFKDVGSITKISKGARLECATTHLCKTKLAEDLAKNATSVMLEDAAGITVGSLVYIAAFGKDEVEVIVTGKSGNKIHFADVGNITTITADDSVVASQEFSIQVIDKDEYVEVFHGLSTMDKNDKNFFENRISGTNNESDWIDLTDKEYAKTNYHGESIPIIRNSVLVNGTDGEDVDESDIVGSSTSPKSGVHLFDGVELDYVCAPGYSSVAGNNLNKSLISWAKARGDVVYVHSHLYNDNTPEKIRNHKSKMINYPSSFAAMYTPWFNILHPTKNGKTIWMPPEGWVCAEAAFVARNYGIHFPPANTPLAGDIVDMSMVLGDGDGSILGIMNNEGINVIRYFEGQGYRIYGARTSSQLQNGFHLLNIRVYVNWVKRSVTEFLRNYAIRPNMQAYRTEIEESLTDFFTGEWELGRLVPEDDASQAFFVQCNRENNPTRLVDQGYLIVDAGIQPPPPAEFIVFNIALFDGGSVTISESTIHTA